jgi:hypothetical protein
MFKQVNQSFNRFRASPFYTIYWMVQSLSLPIIQLLLKYRVIYKVANLTKRSGLASEEKYLWETMRDLDSNELTPFGKQAVTRL